MCRCHRVFMFLYDLEKAKFDSVEYPRPPLCRRYKREMLGMRVPTAESKYRRGNYQSYVVQLESALSKPAFSFSKQPKLHALHT